YGQGSKLALPIVGAFMENTYTDPQTNVRPALFKRPKKRTIETNCTRLKTASVDSRGAKILDNTQSPTDEF
ncbi:MAG TPA: hypothetical protein VL947_00700, partial [Cytophagales bacterium]|nr:hypothetical protein [Cytophagales bacterium]